MSINVERVMSWITLAGVVGGGFLRFGAVETKVQDTTVKVEKLETKTDAAAAAVTSAEVRLVERFHSLDTNVQLLAQEVRALRMEMERVRGKNASSR